VEGEKLVTGSFNSKLKAEKVADVINKRREGSNARVSKIDRGN